MRWILRTSCMDDEALGFTDLFATVGCYKGLTVPRAPGRRRATTQGWW